MQARQLLARSVWAIVCANTRRRFPVASSSVSHWRGHSWRARRSSMADEPTGSLDAHTGELITELLFELNREAGSTLVLVTHDGTLAARCARRIALHAGRIRDQDG